MTRDELRRAIQGATSVSLTLNGAVRGAVLVDRPSIDPATGVLRGEARGVVVDRGTLRRAELCAIVAADVVRVLRVETPTADASPDADPPNALALAAPAALGALQADRFAVASVAVASVALAAMALSLAALSILAAVILFAAHRSKGDPHP